MKILNSNEFVKFLFYCRILYRGNPHFGWLYTLWILRMKQFLIILLYLNAFAEQKYNPYSNTLETVANPYTNQYKYAAPDALPKLNPFSGEYELASPDSAPKYNPYSNEYEIVPDTFEPTFNPYSGEYEMAPQGDLPEFNPYNGQWEFIR